MVHFEWDRFKEVANFEKHGINFWTASLVFEDPHRVISRDEEHSETEERFYCIGKVNDKIVTVRFVQRGDLIRIIGAGYWRKGRKFYDEKKNKRRYL